MKINIRLFFTSDRFVIEIFGQKPTVTTAGKCSKEERVKM